MRIAVLYGGTSPERDVSLVTGRAVASALTDAGHDVLLVDPARGDRPVGAGEAAAAAEIGREAPHPEHETGSAVAAVAGEAVSGADVVFVALHGGTGEDGTIQGLLELAGKRYTGSGVLGSALAMDKRASKLLFGVCGVPTPQWEVVSFEGAKSPGARGGSPSLPSDIDPDRASEAVFRLGGLPVVVKPNDQGSTVGLTVVEDPVRLEPAIRLARDYSSHVLLERYVKGREVTVAVLEGEPLPVVEIVPKKGLYDYESKYTKGASDYYCPADLPTDVSDELRRHALTAFSALGLRGYARIDFLVDGRDGPLCLEANTVPGMTETSLVPMAARAAGLGFRELVERIVGAALS